MVKWRDGRLVWTAIWEEYGRRRICTYQDMDLGGYGQRRMWT